MSISIASNSSTTANLSIGASSTGSLDFFGDTDWWRVSLTAGYGYRFWVEGVSASAGTLSDPFLAIFSSTGTFLAGHNDIGYLNYDSYYYFIPNSTGDYFLSAEEYGNNAFGSYKITSRLDLLSSTASVATASPNSMTTDILFSGADSDWYKINLTAGIKYQFDLVGSNRDGASRRLEDGWLALRDANGVLISSDDDSGDGFNARIYFTPSTSGIFFLDVQESGSNASGTYSLIVNQSPVSGTLTLGSSVSGSIDFLGDANLYSVTLTAGVAYGFQVLGGTLADPYLEILNSNGAVLFVDDDSGSGLNSQLLFTPTVSGTYYLAARAATNAGTGTFEASCWNIPLVSIADAQVTEANSGTTNLNFLVSLSAPSPIDISVTAGTRASTSSTASGDYQGIWETTIYIPAGTTSVNFSIPVNGDLQFEPNEGFRAVLSNPTNALLGDSEARGWIFDDDAPYLLPSDRLVGYQWHLYPDTGANVFPVWSSWLGRGVKVGVFDQGIDPSHSDLDGNLLTNLGRIAATLLPGGAPILSTDNHGTAVAGVIAAEMDGNLTVGVAPSANLVSIYSSLSGSDSVFASEITNAYTYARKLDILNDSWGFGNYSNLGPNYPWAFKDNFRTSPFSQSGQALKALAELGRNGLGTIVVQSAGNSYDYGDDTNLHNFQNSRYIITVAATDYSGAVAGYSSPGASILVAAPGGVKNDFLGGIFTTDRTGSAGYSNNNYDSVQGTSFSAPVVSGVVALMLEANPNLGYRDVQQILAFSARSISKTANDWKYNGASNWNGGGLHYDAFSHNLGFGLVDALAAVRLAETWGAVPLTSSNDFEVSATRSFVQAIPDGSSLLQQSLTISDAIEVERVEVTINITHTYVGDLSILLTSPSGTNSFLLWRAGQNDLSAFGQSQDNIDFTFNTVLSMGESGVGTWYLSVFDMAAGDVGQLNSWTLNLIGKPDSTDDTYIYTNEFAEALLDQGSRATLTDSSGIDTLNAAAVTSAMVLDLGPGAVSTIVGRSLTVDAGSTIENAYGGDGGDTIRGNSVSNVLYGTRGNDSLDGGLGDDKLYGGSDSDILTGGVGNDSLYGGLGSDTAVFKGLRKDYQIVWSASNAAFTVTSSSEGTDVLTGIEILNFSDLSLTSTVLQDITAPTVSTFAPLDGATGVAIDSNIVLTFSEAVQKGTGTIEIRSGSATGTLIESFDAATSTRLAFSGSTLTIDPTANLANNTSYFVTFASGSVKDLANNNYAGTTTYDFKTVADTTAPTVTTFAPIDGATGVAVDSNVVLTFTEAVQKGTGTIEIRSGSATGTLEESFDAATSARLAFSGSTLTIDPAANLANNTSYFVTFAAGSVKDLANNNYGGTATYDFKTVAETTPPTVLTFAPVDGATGAAVDSNIVLTFSEAVQKGTGTIEIRSGSATGTLVESFDAASSTRLAFSGSTLTIDPTANLANNASYFVTFASGSVKDLADNNYAGTTTYDFVTALPTPTSGKDNLTGTTGNDSINALAGNDTIDGGEGNDTLTGGTGVDTFNITAGTDRVMDLGAGGADVLSVSSGAAVNATVTAAWTATADTANSGTANFTSAGFAVNLSAVTSGSKGFSVANTGKAASFTGSSLADSLTGGTGNDTLVGGGGTDTLVGGAGNDIMTGGTGADSFVLLGSDTVVDFNSTDSDTLITTSLIAGAIVTFTSVTGSVDLSSSTTTAAFRATASASGASIVGGSGDDTLSGRTGTDSLSGGSGNDRISASGGADTVIGGRGIDNLSGGTGSDTFVFFAGDTGQATGSDTVSDFAKGAVNTGDRIDYSADLVIGGSLGAATTSEALINQSTGIATFAAKSGTTLADALADIATRFTAAGDAAGEIALFRVAGKGNHYLFISDGTAGVTVNDVVVQLVDLIGVASIDLSGGNLTITG